MNYQLWLAGLAGALVFLFAFAIWRFFSTANKGIKAVTETANEAITAVKPVVTAVAGAVDGAGRIVHGGADLIGVLNDSLRDSLQNKQKERVNLTGKIAELTAQVEQLKTRQVQATAIEQQLEVAFFSIKSKYTSFHKEQTELDAGGYLGLERPTKNEYVGVVEATYTRKVGVDIKQLGFVLGADRKTVYVYGAHVVHSVGMRELSFHRPFQEARLVYDKTDRREGRTEVLKDKGADFLNKASHRHQDEVMKEIQNSDFAASMAEPNEKIAIAFFGALMGAGRYEFKAAQGGVPEDALSFEALCARINQQIGDEITKLEESKAENASRASALDHEIIDLAIAGNSVGSGLSSSPKGMQTLIPAQ